MHCRRTHLYQPRAHRGRGQPYEWNVATRGNSLSGCGKPPAISDAASSASRQCSDSKHKCIGSTASMNVVMHVYGSCTTVRPLRLFVHHLFGATTDENTNIQQALPCPLAERISNTVLPEWAGRLAWTGYAIRCWLCGADPDAVTWVH